MKRVVLLVLLLLLVLTASVGLASSTQTGTVSGGWLRLRSEPSFDSYTINSYNTGTVVTILNTTGSWYYVRTPDAYTGYMYSSYVQRNIPAPDPGAAKVTVTSENGYAVNLRTGPGTSYSVIHSYSPGTTGTLVRRGSEWSSINIWGTTGYMMNQFLRFEGEIIIPTPNPDATIWSSNGYGVRLRSGASTYSPIIGVYSVGTAVRIIENGYEFSKIQVGNKVGYMMTQFLISHSYGKKIEAVRLSSNNPEVGSSLYGETSPAGATVKYEWYADNRIVSRKSHYTPTTNDIGKRIYLVVTGEGHYSGTAQTNTSLPVVSATSELIVESPLDQIVNKGERAWFSVTAIGDAPFTYQWQISQNADRAFTNITSGTYNNSSYQTGVTAEMHNGYRYRCVVHDRHGNKKVSAPATLFVEYEEPLVVTINPSSILTVTEGERGDMLISVHGGSGSYSYQWQIKTKSNWTNITQGATNQWLQTGVTNAKKHNGYQYRCVVTDYSGNSATSDAVTLNVIPATTPSSQLDSELIFTPAVNTPNEYNNNNNNNNNGLDTELSTDLSSNTIAEDKLFLDISLQPTNQTVSEGQKAVYFVDATSSSSTFYQWQIDSGSGNWTDINGANGNSYETGVTKPKHNGYRYRCIISNDQGEMVISDEVLLTVQANLN